ncbi:MAG: hypothetical protein K2W95_03705 [Candidatus Obscuribacterales bacterium]|nr:hypothetical protein [Candidatus Obscuribacterales bacterium]
MNGIYEELKQDSGFAIEVAETARRFRDVLDATFGAVPCGVIADRGAEASAVVSLLTGILNSSNGASACSQSRVTTVGRPTKSAPAVCDAGSKKYEILHWIEW